MTVAAAIPSKRALVPFGSRPIKGYDEEMSVFGISCEERPGAA
jgi:hypothetical protein